ncbi:hypothetical protein H6A68_02780 [Bifidobacterium pullorum subsp. saeculare]|uniref:hypothetical protein n=1 Tax=Bifidobacterium pullorum TaxID=78448 RepID=UPI00195EE5E3|nr:hypothetical protein [Bifidobacterium pullorum]MBM6705988.1 hypothetical protein [Bifidobacterium pullorum subsp. saeculare]
MTATTPTATPTTTDLTAAIATADELVQQEYDAGFYTGSPLPAITDPGYALPAVAGILREEIFGAEILPPTPRIALISEAMTLAAAASWLGVQTVALVAAPGDLAAIQLTAAGAMLMRDVTAGDDTAGTVRVTTHAGGNFHLHAITCARNLLEACAGALPAGTTLADLADTLDHRAPGMGQWRAALAVITPRQAVSAAA